MSSNSGSNNKAAGAPKAASASGSGFKGSQLRPQQQGQQQPQSSQQQATPITPKRATSSSAGSSNRQSLSTTPTQSQILNPSAPSRLSVAGPASVSASGVPPPAAAAGATGTLKAPAINNSAQALSSPTGTASAETSTMSSDKPLSAPPRGEYLSYADDAQQGGSTLGRSGVPRSAGIPQRAYARSGAGSVSTRDESQSRRSVSAAPSDFETVSGLSASEYDSGDDDDAAQLSRTTDFLNAPNDSINSRQGRPVTVFGSGSVAGRSVATGSQSGSRARPRRASNVRSGKEGGKKSKRADPFADEEEEDRYGPLDDEDDEVQPRDLGEELVKRRMKARQKEKARKKKLEEAEKRRQSQAFRPPSSIPPSSPVLEGVPDLSRPPLSPNALDRDGRPVHISIPPPVRPDQLLLSPGSQVSPGMLRTASSAQSAGGLQQQQQQFGGGALVYPSPHGHIRRPVSSIYAPQSSAAGGGRRHSGVSGVSGSAHPSSQAGTVTAGAKTPSVSGAALSDVGGDVFSDDGRTFSEIRAARSAVAPESTLGDAAEDEEYSDERRDAITGLAHERGREPVRHSDLVQDAELNEEEAVEDEEDVVDEEEMSPNSTSGDDIDTNDVEYTLKDRQDAINIEHPFGLPIWKPALYKKSRSVTRNAETALHSVPSAAAQRHLLPGNLLWTLLFGSWLSLICFAGSVILRLVPKGGDKYARVAWELGGYIFWPFGKYVEVEVSPFSGERNSAFAGEDEFDAQLPDVDSYENAFTPVAARFPHDHTHHVPFNSRPAVSPALDHRDAPAVEQSAESSSSSSQGGNHGTLRASDSIAADTTTQVDGTNENTPLSNKGKGQSYGTLNGEANEEEDRVAAEAKLYSYVYDAEGNEIGTAERVLGKIAYGIVFWLFLAPFMGVVCLLCWVLVFTIPMAKLSWVLLKNLSTRPLALHFRSALAPYPKSGEDEENDGTKRVLRPGQLAPRSKSFTGTGDAPHRRSKILLCTYRALGAQYYKYTVGGVNIIFINTLPLIFFTIFDFFFLEPYVEHHKTGGLLAFVASQGFIFMMALGSVIPLSYFIGMAVASISAQSSIGMGAVINATFGSIVEIILYAMALTEKKARLVEGSIVGSILAGVLLMPGLSMCSGATRRKEQRFNARSAGVTSTMLIMAIIGILTPTLFYQIYGTFQLTCEGCPKDGIPGESWTCKRCFYEHVPPATDPFFQSNVKGLMYTCTVILIVSYGVGLWFSLRTHASQIWQNPQPASHSTGNPSFHQGAHAPDVNNLSHRASIYKKFLPAANVVQQLLPVANRPHSQASQPSSAKDGFERRASAPFSANEPPPLQLPGNLSQQEVAGIMATASAIHAYQQEQQQQHRHSHPNKALPRQVAPRQSVHEAEEDEGGHGGHDAPSWSRKTSVSVLLGCTVLYAIIAEVLVDVVDVVLDGSGIDEKFLGITLFALVPNTTEFMNAMSFAINGNIALSMEIGSAYALQVCLIQIPVMVLFSGYYNATHDFPGGLVQRSFTLIFPRWDVIAIIFSVFLLTYTYIEARSNYYRGAICILSYLVLCAGFFFAPSTGDSEMPPGTPNLFTVFATQAGALGGQPISPMNALQTSFGGLKQAASKPALEGLSWLYAVFASLWAR